MKLQEAFKKGIEVLGKSGIEDSAVDAGSILSHVLNKNRAFLYAYGDKELTSIEEDEYFRLIEKRRKREPVQYITGRQEFMGLEFFVNAGVLIPRPDTEILVETVLDYIKKNPAGREGSTVRILDIGTGSGCIAVSLAKFIPHALVIALDISEDALKTAAQNAVQNGVEDRIKFIKSDLFQGIKEDPFYKNAFDIIVSNPPYIPSYEMAGLQEEVRDFEPEGSLGGGEDGLEFYREICTGSPEYLKPGGFLAFEAGYDQAERVKEIMSSNFTEISIVKDYAQIFRVIAGNKKN